MDYRVTITESLSRTEHVEATSAKRAEDAVRYRYRKAEIILDESHFVDVDFQTICDDTLSIKTSTPEPKFQPFYKSPNKDFTLVKGDCVNTLSKFKFGFDMIFADPPYFLSGGGISCQNGKVVCVNKGEWDKPTTTEDMDKFNFRWLSACRDHMKEDATIWISGTHHNIFSVQQQLLKLGFKILNVITWAKTNPPPNISCRYFTYSTEFVIWARKSAKVPHYYNYDLMKHINGDKQMTDVWRLPAIAPWEKSCGKHPTQKPLGLLSRIILASTRPGAWILDPFSGSSTTGIAANLLNRRFLGIEKEENFAAMSKARREEIENLNTFATYKNKITDIVKSEDTQIDCFRLAEDPPIIDLPFIADEQIMSEETTSKTGKLIPKPQDRIMCVKVGKVKRENLYEMTRKYWKATLSRASKATHVLAIADGVVKTVYLPEKWKITDNPKYAGRCEFVGEEDCQSEYIGKSVREYYGRSANPVKYLNM